MELQELIHKAHELYKTEYDCEEAVAKAKDDARHFFEKNLLGRCFKVKRTDFEEAAPSYYAVTEVKKWGHWRNDYVIVYIMVRIIEIDEDNEEYYVIDETYCSLDRAAFLRTDNNFEIEEITREAFKEFMLKAQQTLIDRINNAVNKKENHGTRED